MTADSTGGTGRVLVVGLGRPDRGDDAVGLAVAQAVAAVAPPHVVVLAYEDPTDLLELWAGFEVVVLVDAVRSGAPRGSIRMLETGTGGDALPDSAWSGTGRAGTHAFGVAAAVELGRALHRLPPQVLLVGVEAGEFALGAPLSPPVADAVPAAVRTVLDLVGQGEVYAGPAARSGHVPG
jgi:hydrogenase maturation protease